jgi:hypothetical protein
MNDAHFICILSDKRYKKKPDRAFSRVGLLALVDVVRQIVISLIEEVVIVRFLDCLF